MYQEPLFGKYVELENQHKYGHLTRAEFLKELKSMFPFDSRSFRMRTWTLYETVLIYYELNADIVFSHFDHFSLDPFLNIIDDEKLLDLLKNYPSHKLRNHKDSIFVNEFLPFLTEMGVPIPSHLNPLRSKIGPTSDKNSMVITANAHPTNPIELVIEHFGSKGLKNTSIRKGISRILAALIWKVEVAAIQDGHPKIKKLTSPTKMAENSEIKQIISGINTILHLEALTNKGHATSGVDPEWFSDLFPGEKKPGPQRKPRKKIS